MFIKEGTVLKEQVKYSTYYEMTLEQHWEQIFASENMNNEGNTVAVDAAVECEVVTVGGAEAMADQKDAVDGVMWFRRFNKVTGETSVGLGIEIVERMKRERDVGWASGQEK
ncbi:hypothetical protein OIU84_021136 [Salix udensis]|uniref:Uncharacterized protein n=1 Tax=Salix udensis TaxID=889485 RepID=A0AAD6PIL7_9ROSI|nr:hypothetical protein OIU84_021136 [Salix udensis]